MLKIEDKGNFNNIEQFFRRALNPNFSKLLNRYAEKGLQALRKATPKDSGTTADSWRYDIIIGKDRSSIQWYNTNVNDGANIAILLQYGHALRNGSYVQGIDYINPALQTEFDNLANEIWQEVTKL